MSISNLCRMMTRKRLCRLPDIWLCTCIVRDTILAILITWDWSWACRRMLVCQDCIPANRASCSTWKSLVANQDTDTSSHRLPWYRNAMGSWVERWWRLSCSCVLQRSYGFGNFAGPSLLCLGRKKYSRECSCSSQDLPCEGNDCQNPVRSILDLPQDLTSDEEDEWNTWHCVLWCIKE